MKAKSLHGSTFAEIQSAFQHSLADGFKPTIAIIFISVKQDRQAVCNLLRLHDIDILGATSCGEFTDGHQIESAIVLLLMDMSRDCYRILFENIEEGSVSEAATRLAQSALSEFDRPAFILCSTSYASNGSYMDGVAVIEGIEKTVGADVTICGGMAGDDGMLSATYVFTNNDDSDQGIAALVLDESKIEIYGMAISGWKPLGISRTITKSRGTLVYTIDDQPATEMYLRLLGKETMNEDANGGALGIIGLYYPLLMDRPEGEPVLRSPMSIDHKENALVCDLEMPQGATLRFSMPPDFDIVEKIIEEANELKTRNQTDAEALLIFSCAGRIQALGPLVTAENEGLQKVWNAPMAGFFTYGEYGRTINGAAEFHSGTCSWVALKEK